MNATRANSDNHRDEHRHRSHAGPARLDAGEGDGGQHDDPESYAGAVEPTVAVAGALAHQAHGRHQRDEHDRHVDEEDRPPVEGIDQHAAQQRPCRQSEAAYPRPHADRPRLGGPIRVRVADDGERPREQQRRADALDDARSDEHAVARRDPAGQRPGAEHHEAGQHHALVAAQVADRPAGEHERRQRQRIAVDHPLQPADARAEGAADLGQRDVDDGHVEQHEEVPHAHDHQHGARRGLAWLRRSGAARKRFGDARHRLLGYP